VTTYSESAWGSSDATYPTSILTKRWTTTNETVVAANQDTGEPEDDYTFEQEWSVANRRLNSWDTVEDGNELNIEIVVRFRINETALQDFGYGIFLRASGAAGSESGYAFFVDENFTNGMRVTLYEYSSGTNSLIQVGLRNSLDMQNSQWAYMRCRVNGTAPATLQAKLWKDTEDEPADWDVDTTDSTHTSAGWNGIFGFTANYNAETDYIGGGTNGDTAPIAIDTANEVRLTAAYAQVLEQQSDPEARLTAAYAQVLEQQSDPQVRLTAAYAQVLYKIATDTPVDSDHVIPIEWLQGLDIDRQIPVEWDGPLNADLSIPVEWFTELLLDHQIPFSWINVTTPGDHLAPVEWRQGVAADNQIPVAWLQGIASDSQAPISWDGPLNADSIIPVEWYLVLNIDKSIPFDWTLTTTPGDHQVPAEWRSGIAQDHQILFAWRGEPQPPADSVIPFAWRGPFADPGADFPLLFDWKLELEIDGQTPVEWKTELETDHQSPVEWLLENVIVSLHQTPINWAGVIDVDEIIPFEWTTELLVDRVIPYDWQLTIFLELDRQMPVEWKLDVILDNSIPVEWFLQLQLDHQIPIAWSGEFGVVDFVIPYEWALDVVLDASVPVEWNLDVLPAFAIPVEWKVDVGDDSTILVEWLSLSFESDQVIPITWSGPVHFDQVIPFEWLSEGFVQFDSVIPIEYQQIFLKKFDSVIWWEARGILDETRTIPIEWRSDPGFDAVVPYEWTDPLFALFVTREEDCEFWLADCNSVGWEAIRCASLWLADELPHEAQSAEEPGGTWVAHDEEIGGTWFAAERTSNWEAPCLPTVWIAYPPDIWYADECPAMWFAQEQSVLWAAEAHAARWIVLEPNLRGDR